MEMLSNKSMRLFNLSLVALRLSFVALACLLVPSPGLSEGREERPEHSSESITFRVRTVQAMENLSPEQVSSEERVVDSNLGDLKDKFNKLPFRTFKLVDTQERQVTLKKRELIRLPNGDSLAVRPLHLDGEKISIWLKWQDKSGASILDTRLHFHCGESMITGTDGTSDNGLVLAINVNAD
jgi:hypothetical protein